MLLHVLHVLLLLGSFGLLLDGRRSRRLGGCGGGSRLGEGSDGETSGDDGEGDLLQHFDSPVLGFCFGSATMALSE
jgi:hypothetical protein